MLVRSLPMKNRKGVARGLFHIIFFVTHDVTGTHCGAQNDSTHGRVFCDFQRRTILKQKQTGLEIERKTGECV